MWACMHVKIGREGCLVGNASSWRCCQRDSQHAAQKKQSCTPPPRRPKGALQCRCCGLPARSLSCLRAHECARPPAPPSSPLAQGGTAGVLGAVEDVIPRLVEQSEACSKRRGDVMGRRGRSRGKGLLGKQEGRRHAAQATAVPCAAYCACKLRRQHRRGRGLPPLWPHRPAWAAGRGLRASTSGAGSAACHSASAKQAQQAELDLGKEKGARGRGRRGVAQHSTAQRNTGSLTHPPRALSVPVGESKEM